MSQHHSEGKDKDGENVLTSVDPAIKIPMDIKWIINNYNVLDNILLYYVSKFYILPVYHQFKYQLSIYESFNESVIIELCFLDSYLKYKAYIDCTILLGFKNGREETINIFKVVGGDFGGYNKSWEIFECSQGEWKWKYAERLRYIKLTGTFTLQKRFSYNLVIKEAARNNEIRNLFQDINRRDFNIVVGTDELKVHKSILLKNSPVFSTMLESDMWTEAKEGKIDIKDFPFKLVKIAVDALYGECYEEQLIIDEYILLYLFSDKYDMGKLREAVKNSIILSPHNICRYANLFLSKNLQELVDYCIDFLLVCSQYSLPVHNMDDLDVIMKIRFFERALQKGNVETENTSY